MKALPPAPSSLAYVTPTLSSLLKFSPGLQLIVRRNESSILPDESFEALLLPRDAATTTNRATGATPQEAINALEFVCVVRNPDQAIEAYKLFQDKILPELPKLRPWGPFLAPPPAQPSALSILLKAISKFFQLP